MKKLFCLLPFTLLATQPATAPAAVMVRTETVATVCQKKDHSSRVRQFPMPKKRFGKQAFNIPACIGLGLEVIGILIFLLSSLFQVPFWIFMAGGAICFIGLILGLAHGWKGNVYALIGAVLSAIALVAVFSISVGF